MAAHAEGERWVVLDVESTGLDVQRDRLVAVAALAVRVWPGTRPCIVPGDSFECVVSDQHASASVAKVAKVAKVDKPNILVHGIGLGERRQGLPPSQAMAALGEWLGSAPVLGFHVAFDEALIQRTRREWGLAPLVQPFIDLAPIAGAVRPQVRARTLDDWMLACQVECEARHVAAADALATAEVLLHLWEDLVRDAPRGQGVTAPHLAQLARSARWLTSPR